MPLVEDILVPSLLVVVATVTNRQRRKWAKPDRRQRLPGLLVNPYRGFRHDAARRCRLKIDKGHGKIQLADGPGLPDGRGWYRHWRSCSEVMAEGFERMQHDLGCVRCDVRKQANVTVRRTAWASTSTAKMPKATPKNWIKPLYDLIKPVVAAPKEFEDREIIDRLMIPHVPGSRSLPGRKHCFPLPRGRHGSDHGHRFPSVPVARCVASTRSVQKFGKRATSTKTWAHCHHRPKNCVKKRAKGESFTVNLDSTGD